MTKTYTTQQQIKALENTPPVLIATDSGTHAMPDRCSVYLTVEGKRYGTYSFANCDASCCTVKEAIAETPGRMRWLREAEATMKAATKELAALRRTQRREDQAARGF